MQAHITTVNLIHGDCMDVLKAIPNGSIDCILTSPPYQTGKNYDESVSLHNFITICCEKIKPNGVFIFQVGNRVNNGFIYPIDILTYKDFIDNGFKLVNRVIWTFGHGLHCSKRLSGRYETVCIYARSKQHTFNLDSIRIPQKYPNKKHYKGNKKGQYSGNPLGKNPADVWDITNVKHNHPEKTQHPCQFPEELVTRLVSCFTNELDVVLDPFMGSGTTGIVCKRLKRNFIGIELDNLWFSLAEARINAEDFLHVN
jgi:adenine-specific DNA-methyltransferase